MFVNWRQVNLRLPYMFIVYLIMFHQSISKVTLTNAENICIIHFLNVLHRYWFWQKIRFDITVKTWHKPVGRNWPNSWHPYYFYAFVFKISIIIHVDIFNNEGMLFCSLQIVSLTSCTNLHCGTSSPSSCYIPLIFHGHRFV